MGLARDMDQVSILSYNNASYELLKLNILSLQSSQKVNRICSFRPKVGSWNRQLKPVTVIESPAAQYPWSLRCIWLWRRFGSRCCDRKWVASTIGNGIDNERETTRGRNHQMPFLNTVLLWYHHIYDIGLLTRWTRATVNADLLWSIV